jgi:hypothetical protein
MPDPISGDALQRAAKTAHELQGPGAGAEKTGDTGPAFEKALNQTAQDQEKVKDVLQTDLKTQVDRVPETEKARLRVELETQVNRMERTDQHRWFASRIERSEQSFLRLDKRSTELPSGEWKQKLVDRLDEYRSAYGDLDKFLVDFKSGRPFSPEELLAIQMQTQQMSQSIELLAKTVEQSVSGMKTIFQTNV